MWKKIIVFTFCFYCTQNLFSQFEKGNFLVSAQLGQLKLNNYRPITQGGVDFQFFVTQNMSLNLNFRFGNGYLHTPAMAYFFSDLFIYGTLFSDDDDLLWLILFSEGISFHIPVHRYLILSPYLNPLGYEYIYQQEKESIENEFSSEFLSGCAGVKMNVCISRLVLGAYIEAKWLYSDNSKGLGTGLCIGYKF